MIVNDAISQIPFDMTLEGSAEVILLEESPSLISADSENPTVVPTISHVPTAISNSDSPVSAPSLTPVSDNSHSKSPSSSPSSSPSLSESRHPSSFASLAPAYSSTSPTSSFNSNVPTVEPSTSSVPSRSPNSEAPTGWIYVAFQQAFTATTCPSDQSAVCTPLEQNLEADNSGVSVVETDGCIVICDGVQLSNRRVLQDENVRCLSC